MRSDLGCQFKQALVALSGCSQLHTANLAGNGNHGVAAEAEGDCVAQDAAAGTAVICSDAQCDDG